jgi:mannose-6-phosphate isomerase-like protein (cupin superfamily)
MKKGIDVMKRILTAVTLLVLGMAIGWLIAKSPQVSTVAQATAQVTEGYILEHDAEVAKPGPAPHKGPGRSTGYSFFEKATDFKQVFRKRVLHPGAAIGYHPQKEDEVYYILSGTGVMQMNGKEFPVKPGDAILTRPGSSHGLKQTGKDDLALIIAYEKK